MIKGWLWKSTSSYAGSMEKVYCVLVGTLVLDFESAEDFTSGAPPRAEGEVIGVSVWKGKSWPRGAHTKGFVYVTRLGHTNYCAVRSEDHHERWMLWMRTALDMALGTEGAGPLSGGVAITREALHRGVLEPPKPAESAGGLIIVFGAVEGLLLFLCGSGEYDELTLVGMLSTLAKAILALCRQGNKSQRVTETVFLTSSIYNKACLVIDEMLPGGILESLDVGAILNAIKLQRPSSATLLSGSTKGR